MTARDQEKSGFLLIDKPIGMTSRKVVDLLIHASRYRGKVGHAGTLDPLASGLLILCFGRGTRLAQYLIEDDKRYTTSFFLGEETATCDREGEVIARTPAEQTEALTVATIEEALGKFTGSYLQVPPVYSARKVNGKRSYELARQGINADLHPNTVRVRELTLLSWEAPVLALSILCSTGTYIRALARDIGRELGVGAHVISLERLGVGPLTVEEAIPLEEATTRVREEGLERMLLPIELPLRSWSKVKIDEASRHRLLNGSKIVVGERYLLEGEKDSGVFPRRVGIWGQNGGFIGVGRLEAAGSRAYVLYPEKVLATGPLSG
jgi:tRNA pseudouridine55 synthase